MERVEKMIALVAIAALCAVNLWTISRVGTLEQRVSDLEGNQTQIVHSIKSTVDVLMELKMQGRI